MLDIEVLAGIIAKVVEHRFVLHVMPVDNVVIALSHHAVLVNIRNAVIAVLLLKAVLQIVVWIIRCPHNRVVDVRAVDGDPANKIAVLIEKSPVLLHCQLCFSRSQFFRRECLAFRLVFTRLGDKLLVEFALVHVSNHVGQVLKLLCAVLLILILVMKHDAREYRDPAQDHNSGDANDLFDFHIKLPP